MTKRKSGRSSPRHCQPHRGEPLTLSMKEANLLRVLICSFSWVRDGLDVGVHLQLEGAQQALVHGDSCDALNRGGPAVASSHTHAGAQATPKAAAAAAHSGKGRGADAGAGPLGVGAAAEGPGAEVDTL